jgi:hypothetical protein
MKKFRPNPNLMPIFDENQSKANDLEFETSAKLL